MQATGKAAPVLPSEDISQKGEGPRGMAGRSVHMWADLDGRDKPMLCETRKQKKRWENMGNKERTSIKNWGEKGLVRHSYHHMFATDLRSQNNMNTDTNDTHQL